VGGGAPALAVTCVLDACTLWFDDNAIYVIVCHFHKGSASIKASHRHNNWIEFSQNNLNHVYHNYDCFALATR
jgi:hypothetical protein